MGIGISDGTFYTDNSEALAGSHMPMTSKELSDAKEMQANSMSGDFQSRFLASNVSRSPSEAPQLTADALKEAGGRMIAGNGPKQETWQDARDTLFGMNGKERYQLWPERALRELWHAAKAPGEVAQGKLPMWAEDPETGELRTSPVAIDRANTLAGAMVMGPAPVAKGLVDGTLGSFVGVQSKTFDKTRLAKAQKMEQEGYHPDEIWRDTQTFRGYEGRWRQEISDKDMKFTEMPWTDKGMHQLAEIINHPELFKAYPELKQVIFKPDKDYKYIASYNSETNTITVNPSKAKSDSMLLDVITHELQHKIQRKEGFEQGTNPGLVYGDALAALRKRLDTEKLSPSERKELSNLYWAITDKEARFADFLYRSAPGEVEANLSAASRQLSDTGRARFSPDQRQKYLEGTTNPLTGQSYVPPNKFGVEAALAEDSAVTNFRRGANDNLPEGHPDRPYNVREPGMIGNKEADDAMEASWKAISDKQKRLADIAREKSLMIARRDYREPWNDIERAKWKKLEEEEKRLSTE